MNQIVTQAILLSRTNYGEADRILSAITPDYGKRRLMAKGVRKERSKLAGGIELFSISHITYIPGKKEIDTLISTRLVKHFSQITTDVDRTMLGYTLLKHFNRNTEDAASEEYFQLLASSLKALDELKLKNEIIEAWFDAQLIKLGGHQPNLKTDANGNKLKSEQSYVFDFDTMVFTPKDDGKYDGKHIKLIRLLFGLSDARELIKVGNIESVLQACCQLMNAMSKESIRI